MKYNIVFLYGVLMIYSASSCVALTLSWSDTKKIASKENRPIIAAITLGGLCTGLIKRKIAQRNARGAQAEKKRKKKEQEARERNHVLEDSKLLKAQKDNKLLENNSTKLTNSIAKEDEKLIKLPTKIKKPPVKAKKKEPRKLRYILGGFILLLLILAVAGYIYYSFRRKKKVKKKK